MIITDLPAPALPGKRDDLVAALKALAAYRDRHWPGTMPRVITVEIRGEEG